ncbi:ly6/PLAUR domain-containing protein 6-like [Lycorma delicatula]|uniref:ly6/PLAUR domain-containing protein 6-like n=1 Tax=Lycorma delicatula TaxID=130591 RepID=UPI003F5185D8
MLNGLGGHLISCFLLAGFTTPASGNRTQTTGHRDIFSDPANDTDTGLTCYTCVNVSDNLMCNQFAIDHPCPKGQNFCHTLHIMDSTGASVVVNKKCANSSECWPLGVGCVLIDAQKVCVACCDEMYCNVTVPTNQSTAVYSQKRTKPRPTIMPSSSSQEMNSLTAISSLTLLLSTLSVIAIF